MVCAIVQPKALGAIHTDDLKDLNNTRCGARCIMPGEFIFIPCLSSLWMAFKTKVMSVAASWPLRRYMQQQDC